MFEVNKTINGGEALVSVSGRLDTVTSPKLEEELKDVLESADSLVFDLEKLDYISSAGLRVLLASLKAMSKKGGMKVINVNETIMEIFEVTGFADILTIE